MLIENNALKLYLERNSAGTKHESMFKIRDKSKPFGKKSGLEFSYQYEIFESVGYNRNV